MTSYNISKGSTLIHDSGVTKDHSVAVLTSTLRVACHVVSNTLRITTIVSNESYNLTEVSSLDATASSYHPVVCRLSDTSFAVAYSDLSNRGVVLYCTCDADGNNISVDATLIHDTAFCTYSSICAVSSTEWMVAYTGLDGATNGTIKTFSVSGSTITEEDKLIHISNSAYFNSLVHITGDFYLLAFYASQDGYVKTISLAGGIDDIVEVDSSLFATPLDYYMSATILDSTHVAVAYSSISSDGYIKIFSIDANADNITLIDTYQFTANYARYFAIDAIDENNILVVYYNATATDGYALVLNLNSSYEVVEIFDYLIFSTTLAHYNSVSEIDATHTALSYMSASSRAYATTLILEAVFNLTATDITAGTPVVDTPVVVSIDHQLTATDITVGTPVVDTPTISQVHGLAVTDVTAGTPVVDVPVLWIAGTLYADDVTIGIPVVATPALILDIPFIVLSDAIEDYNSYPTKSFSSAKLTETLHVVARGDTVGGVDAYTISVDGLGNLAFVDEKIVQSYGAGACSVCRLTDTSFVVANAYTSSSRVSFYTCDADGNNISVGINYDIEATYGATAFSIVPISSTEWMLAYTYGGGFTRSKIKTFSISGTTITEEDAYEFYLNVSSSVSLVHITGDFYLLGYSYGGTTGVLKTISLAGGIDNIVEVDSLTFETTAATGVNVAVIDATHVVVCYKDVAFGALKIYSIDANADNLTLVDTYSLLATSTGVAPVVSVIDTENLLVVYNADNIETAIVMGLDGSYNFGEIIATNASFPIANCDTNWISKITSVKHLLCFRAVATNVGYQLTIRVAHLEMLLTGGITIGVPVVDAPGLFYFSSPGITIGTPTIGTPILADLIPLDITIGTPTIGLVYWGVYTKAYRQAYRVADTSVAGYELYVGEDEMPDFDAAPAATGAALPLNWTVPVPGPGETVVLYAVVRYRNKYGLLSHNQYPTLIEVDEDTLEEYGPLTQPEILNIMDSTSGEVLVYARYPYGVDRNPADEWELYAEIGVDPDPDADTPVATATFGVGGADYIWMPRVAGLTPGSTYRIMAVVRRSDDNAWAGSDVEEFTLAEAFDLDATLGNVFGGQEYEATD